MTSDDVPYLSILEPDEQVQVEARATDAVMLVTDRRVAVAVQDRLAMAVPFESLRRIQWDVERDRHATLILVPEHVADTPQVLVIPPEEYAAVGRSPSSGGDSWRPRPAGRDMARAAARATSHGLGDP